MPIIIPRLSACWTGGKGDVKAILQNIKLAMAAQPRVVRCIYLKMI